MSEPVLTILHEDADILVICKPAGIPTQSPRQYDSVEARVRKHLAAASDAAQSDVAATDATRSDVAQPDVAVPGNELHTYDSAADPAANNSAPNNSARPDDSAADISAVNDSTVNDFETKESKTDDAHTKSPSHGNRPPYLGIPHRLDRCSSGVMVFAKTINAARKLSRQFERRFVEKCYIAWLDGDWPADQVSGVWEDSMRKVPDLPQSEIVAADHPAAQLAILRFEVVAAANMAAVNGSHDHQPMFCPDSGTLMRIRLVTGRMHQIRLQAAHRGHPVRGDRLYGSHLDFGPPTVADRDRSIALHACELAFRHPRSQQDVRFCAPLPTSWMVT